MQTGTKSDHRDIEALVREAQVERQARIGALIGDGLAATWQGLVGAVSWVGRGLRPEARERLAPR